MTTSDQSLVGTGVALDPNLRARSLGGGPTETYRLREDSPALEAGDNATCEATDQRGLPRPHDGDGDGTATCDMGAIEHAPVSIDGLSTSAGIIDLGETVTVTWSSSHADSCSFDSLGPVATSGSIDLNPAATLVLTLTCANAIESDAASVTIVVRPAAIESFTATPATVDLGGSSTLGWSSRNTSSCSVEPGVGTVAASGTVDVTPTATTVFALTCQGDGEPVGRLTTVTVRPVTIESFSASPESVDRGEAVTLTWTSSNATGCVLDGQAVATADSQHVTPESTTTYVLQCHGEGGPATATVTVIVDPVRIVEFTATPDEVRSGKPCTLNWRSQNATLCMLNQDVGTVTPSGSLVVTPPANTTYELLCTGDGPDAIATAAVSVIAAPRRDVDSGCGCTATPQGWMVLGILALASVRRRRHR